MPYSKSARLAALRFHSLTSEDRRWLLRQLSKDERRKLLDAYQALRRMKNFKRLQFQDVYQTLVQADPSVPAVAAPEGTPGESPGLPRFTPSLRKRLRDLPNECIALIGSEELVADMDKFVTELDSSRQRLVKQLQKQPREPLAAPVKAIILDYLQREEGKAND